MLRLITVFAIVLGASATWAGPPATLTTLHAIHSLSHAQAAQSPPVAFEATVTYRRGGETTLFVEDSNEGIYVWAKPDIKVAPGDRVLVRGKAGDSFRPLVVAESVSVLSHGDLPRPRPATFDGLIRARFDCLLVTVRAVVQSADLVWSSDRLTSHVVLVADGGLLHAYINSADPDLLTGLLDAEVEVTGVVSATFDGKMQQTGVALSVSSLDDLRFVSRAHTSAWSLPVSQMDEIISNYHVRNLSQRVRVRGTLTYYQPGSALVIQSGTKSLWIMTVLEKPIPIGEQVDVTGFPDVFDGFLALTAGEVLDRGVYAPIAPLPSSIALLTSSKHIFDLVSIEGQVVMEVRENSQDEYVLVSDGQVFSAIYRHPEVGGVQPLPVNLVPLGSRVRASGICTLGQSNPFRGDVPFDLLLRTPADLVVVARPSPLNVRNLIIAVSLLILAVFAVGARGYSIERKLRRKTAALAARIEAEAALERRRSAILEDINGSRPLPEILEQVAELVSVTLDGAPCWCQVAGGEPIGNGPPGNIPNGSEPLRIVCEEIPGHSGAPPSRLFAALDPSTEASTNQSKALAMGTGLAALALETRRLYSDLLHRSQFDLLTEIHNRFSLDKHLDKLIREARPRSGIFGLIYVDLDEFKQVNDECGHHVGDLYLQEVAMRMKRQVRSVDLLARIGGDEFAVLVPEVRSRTDVEEIALRIERSFDEPVTAAEYVLHASASVGIAVYPLDALTKDGLLNAADSAMYRTKNAKKQIAKMMAGQRDPALKGRS